MRVLVTGSRGYIGSILVPMLLEKGHDVVGLDTNLYRQCTFGKDGPQIETIMTDIRDIQTEALAGFDAVIHLAGLSNDPLGDYQPQLTDEINALASIKLAEMAKAMGVKRFLFASSCSVYGAAGEAFLDETSPFNPVTPYGVSKLKAETGLRKMADDDFSPTFLRASTAYGVSPRIRFDLVANNLTAWAFATGNVYLKSDGSPWRPIVHIEDISRAYAAVLTASRDAIHNQAFNVGTTAENYQIREIAEIVSEVVPGCRIEYAPDAGPDKRCYRVDCNKIARVLRDFKPQWTLVRGVEQLYDAYKRVGLTPNEFEGPNYSRIAHVKDLIDKGELTDSLYWTDAASSTDG